MDWPALGDRPKARQVRLSRARPNTAVSPLPFPATGKPTPFLMVFRHLHPNPLRSDVERVTESSSESRMLGGNSHRLGRLAKSMQHRMGHFLCLNWVTEPVGLTWSSSNTQKFYSQNSNAPMSCCDLNFIPHISRSLTVTPLLTHLLAAHSLFLFCILQTGLDSDCHRSP